jgi:hypothetical protein
VKRLENEKTLNKFINPKNVIVSDNGRGNNWAFGYADVKEPSQERSLLDISFDVSSLL